MRVTERNDSEKVADGDGFDVSASRRDCTHNGDGCRDCTQTANPSRAAELMPHSRNNGKVSSNGQGEATNSNWYRCGKSSHKAAQCPFQTAKCHNCGKTGHLRRVCRQPKPPKHPGAQGSQNRQKVQLVEEVNSEILVLYHDKASSDKPLEVDLQLEGKPLQMEVDTGAAVSLVSEEIIGACSLRYNYSYQR